MQPGATGRMPMGRRRILPWMSKRFPGTIPPNGIGTATGRMQQGREFAQEKYNQGKEFVGEKYNQGVEYAQAIAEQGKTKLDEAKTAVQNFFTKSKKAE